MLEQQDEDEDTIERQGLVASDTKASPPSSSTMDGGITEWEAGVSLAKAIMGAGSFALPWAFLQMGFVAGPVFLFILMTLSVYSLQLLMTCARGSGRHSYVDLARSVFGNAGATSAYAASVSASLGVCGSYLVFIAANLQSLFVSRDGETELEPPLSQTGFIMLVLPLAVLLSAVRDMNHFAFASLLGDVSVVLGMIVVLVYGVWHHEDTAASKEVQAIGSLRTMPLAFGAIGYLFLVHFLTLPIESAMARPERFHRVAIFTFSTCAVLSGGFGVIGYLLFGSETQQIVLLNVQGSYFVGVVKLLLCVDLLLTYPVVMRPSIVIVEQSLKEASTSLPDARTKRRPNYASPAGSTTHFTVCLVLGLVAAAGGIFIPAFGLLSGLVGGVSQTFLAFVLPPLMLIKQRHVARKGRGDESLSSSGTVWLHTNKEFGLVVLGAILIVWTLVTTWNEMISVGE